VYDVTTPSSHNTRSITKIVHSMATSSRSLTRVKRDLECRRDRTA
jgi:hypothetical protein